MNEYGTWVAVFVPARDQVLESITNFLFELGASGAEERPDGILAYFLKSAFTEELSSSLLTYIRAIRSSGSDVGAPVCSELENQNWGESWRKGFKPIRVTKHLVVKPPWENPRLESGTIAIDIYPRMAFGTGTHETTQVCLALLERIPLSDRSVLDLGTGSGILAIAAAKLGAAFVLGLDTDPDAIDNAIENVRLNGVEDRVQVRIGSLELLNIGIRESGIGDWETEIEKPLPDSGFRVSNFNAGISDRVSEKGKFDLIIANIDRSTLIQCIPLMSACIKPGGKWILSGILAVEKKTVEDALALAGWKNLETKLRGEWAGLACALEECQ